MRVMVEEPIQTAPVSAKTGSRPRPLFDPPIVRRAMRDSITKLSPTHMMKNPVMFVVEVGSVVTTLLCLRGLLSGAPGVGFTVSSAATLVTLPALLLTRTR